jgi:hypothetical protein
MFASKASLSSHSTPVVRLVALFVVAVITGVLLFDGRSQAQPKDAPYTLKIYNERKGDRVLVIKDETSTQKMSLKDSDGKVVMDSMEKTVENLQFVEETLEREGTKRATRLRRTYEKAQVTKDGKTTTLPYEGKTVLIAKKGDKYTFTIEGGKELTGEEASLLTKEFDKPESETDLEKLLLPGKPVAAGDSWKIDAGPILKEMSKEAFHLDKEKTTATGKLIKAYKKDGINYGVLEINLNFVLLGLGEAPTQVTFKEPAKFAITMNLDICIDGTSPNGSMTANMAFAGTGTLKGPDGKEFTMMMDMRGSENSRHENKAR